MKIDLSIYNRILFGDLRPWLKENQSEAKFQQKLNPSFRVPKGDINAFEKAINNALKDHPVLLTEEDYIFEIEEDKIKMTAVKDEIFEPLIDIDIPPHFNYKTEFYYYLIKNEGTRLMNNLNKAVQVCGNENEAKFLINTTLLKVKTFLKDTATHLKQIGYTDNLRFDELPKDKNEAQKKITSYILSALETTLMRLLLEIQQTFDAFISSKILSEDEIYLSLLGRTPPSVAVHKLNVRLNDFLVKRYINSGEYNNQKTLDLINDTKEIIARYFSQKTTHKEAANRKALLLSNIQALENLYFIREFGIADTNPNYETLLLDEYTEPIFANANAEILERLEELNLPNKRLAAIIKEEQRFSFLQSKIQIDESALALSIPRKIALMLAVNKAFVKENLKIDFSKLPELKSQRLKVNLNQEQLVTLFRLLAELKPEIFSFKDKTELFNFIASNFESKKSKGEGLKPNKVKNIFYARDSKAADFWEKHLHDMLHLVRKFKES